VEEARVEITPSEETPSKWEDWMNRTTASLLERTLTLLEVPLPKKFKIKPYCNASDSSAQLRQIEMRYFQELDGVLLMKSYFVSAHGDRSTHPPTILTSPS
jgi:hypothetical protein